LRYTTTPAVERLEVFRLGRAKYRLRETDMSRKPKSIPRFRNEAEERLFWETHDSSDYVDWSKAKHARFPNLKPSTKSISLRLPLTLLERIKVAANKRDMPYQSLIKAWLAEKVDTK
jgi:predicted DNA binding CopG/RHH family protein